MTKILALKAEERTETGKGVARSLRRSGRVPGIVYSKGKKEVYFSLDDIELNKLYSKHGFMSHIYELEIGKNKYKALPKEVQLHPVTDNIEHIDFMFIDENKEVRVPVEISFANKSKCVGIKRGGLLNITNFSIDVLCKPEFIPESIEADIANLNIGSSLHVKDLKFPQKVKPAVEDMVTVCAITGRSNDSEEAKTEESDKEK